LLLLGVIFGWKSVPVQRTAVPTETEFLTGHWTEKSEDPRFPEPVPFERRVGSPENWFG
jgi:hypothetical protein